ncbi:YetF domain-containing protein [Halothermothrix orenii]|uniref:Predicted membrane protein n=1 Tax=Halothermothrix orenii (strain H 168 / OCM 544 / DSM 9562) TaxID=373903 RepID=B8D265_HALOH|nr:DUF421 domain-containing protein [Halothermothrix orenii]ACL69292.1 predicted membrane protein [Halothermothrix orenii H 168]
MPFWESQQSLNVFQWIARTGVTFVWLFLMTKIMGQREVGRLTLFDFIIAITIGTVAASSLSNSRTSLLSSLINVGFLAVLDIVLAIIALKNAKVRRIVQGEPMVLIQNGKLLEDSMRKSRMNLDDLLMGLRQKKISNLSDVEFAILEPNGKISVIPRSQSRAVRPKDLKINTGYEGLPVIVIEDGNILEDNLKENNLDKNWLKNQLKQQGIDNVEEVLVGMLDTQGRLYISKKGQKNEDIVH